MTFHVEKKRLDETIPLNPVKYTDNEGIRWDNKLG